MSSPTDSLSTPRPSSLLWRMMLRARSTHLSMIIFLTALLVPFLWVENERGSVSLELGPVLFLSIPLILGCFAALALRTLQRIRHHQMWPGYRAGIRRDGWILTLVAILSGALGSLLDPAIDHRRMDVESSTSFGLRSKLARELDRSSLLLLGEPSSMFPCHQDLLLPYRLTEVSTDLGDAHSAKVFLKRGHEPFRQNLKLDFFLCGPLCSP